MPDTTPAACHFEIAVQPSARVRLLRRAVLSLGVAGVALAAWPAAGRDSGWLLLALGVLMLWAGWRHGRVGLARGMLCVDGQGAAAWRSAEGGSESPQGALLPVRVERWFAGERLAWLRLRDLEGRRYEILVGRASIDEERWRRLSAWLVWLRRGIAS